MPVLVKVIENFIGSAYNLKVEADALSPDMNIDGICLVKTELATLVPQEMERLLSCPDVSKARIFINKFPLVNECQRGREVLF